MPTSHSISWLLDADKTSAEIGLHTKRIEIPYPPTLARGYSEHFDITDGITLIQNKHQFLDEDRPNKIPLGEFKVEFPSISFLTQIMHSGCINIFDNTTQKNIKRTPDVDVFVRLKSFDIEQTLYTEEDVNVSILIFSELQLINLLGAEDAENPRCRLK